MDAPAIDTAVGSRADSARWSPSRGEWVAGLGALVPLIALAVTVALSPAPSAQAVEAALQEDAWVEWSTVFMLFCAAGLFVRAGVGVLEGESRDRVSAAVAFALALFCVAFAGEEISWGQRLFGITPSPLFLEHNFQQELNVHNFLQAKEAPVRLESRHAVASVSLMFAAVLPALSLLARRRAWRSAEAFQTATSSPVQVPFYAAAVYLALVYPFPFAGELAELLLASQLLHLAVRAPPRPMTTAPVKTFAALALPVVLGVSAPQVADAWYSRDAQEKNVTARAELQKLAGALAPQLTSSFFKRRSVNKRLWSAAQAGYLAPGVASGWTLDAARSRHFIDPWGSPYWLRSERGAPPVLYSFGPNRRRDDGGDDLAAIIPAR